MIKQWKLKYVYSIYYFYIKLIALVCYFSQALSQEIIKTIQSVISINPIYKEILHPMLQHGNVSDDPSYLSDIAAAIADCETHEYQEILEEINVRTSHFNKINNYSEFCA